MVISKNVIVFHPSSKMSDKPGPSKAKETSNMTLAEYLSLPENQNANLVQPLAWCPHLETITKEFSIKDFDVKRPCEVCKNEVCVQ